MKLNRLGSAAAVLSIAALALTACGSDNPTGAAESSAAGTETSAAAEGAVSGTLTGIGASTQTSAMEAWANGFKEANPDATVQYSPDGSGAGRKAFLAGGAQFAGSDAYLSAEEADQATEVCGPDGAFNVPAYVSPIAVAFNLEGVDSLNMDAATIAKIFKKEITKWNDPAIAEQNEGVELPDTAITVVHRNDESGTTENFTDYLHQAAGDVWSYDASGEWPEDIQAENAKGTAGVVSTTSSTAGAITYADASAVGDLATVHVKVGDEYTELSADAAAKALESATPAEGATDTNLALDLKRDTTEAGTYPIVLVSYHIFCSTSKDQATVDLVKAFGHFAVSAEGQELAAASAGNAPLSESMEEKAAAAIDTITVAK